MPKTTNAGKGGSGPAGGSAGWCRHCWNQCETSSEVLEIDLSIYLAMLFLVIYIKKLLFYHRDTCSLISEMEIA